MLPENLESDEENLIDALHILNKQVSYNYHRTTVPTAILLDILLNL